MVYPEIQAVADAIAEQCAPLKVYLVSQKTATDGELISFKLAVVVSDDVESISELECRLYAQIDSDYPYDLVLYQQKEWDTLRTDSRTFAWKISQTGSVLYD
ncbi:MAG: hypothetical protein E7501_06585 [Ruminococcus sp.]|nr:hypothetical protein [Ruminococcus sp.]MBQ8905472.1 hypothetical protein [Ruminococcus sp.]